MLLIAEIKQIKSDRKSVFKFAITMAAAFALIGGYCLWRSKSFGVYSLGISGAFLLLGFINPLLLKPLYIVWMSIATVMNFFMSRLILTVLYYLIVTPIGLCMRVFRKNEFNTCFPDKKQSHWISCRDKNYCKENYEKQY
jgi:hypothetical protein